MLGGPQTKSSGYMMQKYATSHVSFNVIMTPDLIKHRLQSVKNFKFQTSHVKMLQMDVGNNGRLVRVCLGILLCWYENICLYNSWNCQFEC